MSRSAWLAPLVGVAVAPAAHAATFNVGACGGSAAASNNSWALTSDDPARLEGVDCGAIAGQNALLAHDKLTTADVVPSGATVRWRFTAPPGTSITHLDGNFTVRRFLSDAYTPFVQSAGGTLLTCVIVSGDRCDAAGPVGGWTVSTSLVELGVRCDAVPGGTCGVGPTLHLVETTGSSIRVTLDDPSSPTVPAPTPGGLWSDVPVGTSGAVTFGATDNTGIAQARMYIDGHLAASKSQPCDYSFAVPCSNHSAMTLSTAGLASGTHTLRLTATDAAGNEAVGQSRTITVSGSVTTPPPGTPPTGPGPTVPRLASKLRIAHVHRTARALTVSGMITRRATGRLTISYRVRRAGHTVVVRGSVAPRLGKFHKVLPLGPKVAAVRRATLSVSFSGDDRVLPLTRRRTLGA